MIICSPQTCRIPFTTPGVLTLKCPTVLNYFLSYQMYRIYLTTPGVLTLKCPTVLNYFLSYQMYRIYLTTPGVSTSSSPGLTPGKMHHTTRTTLEGLTSNNLFLSQALAHLHNITMKYEGHPSGVGLVLLPLSRGETRATGSPALKAGLKIMPLH